MGAGGAANYGRDVSVIYPTSDSICRCSFPTVFLGSQNTRSGCFPFNARLSWFPMPPRTFRFYCDESSHRKLRYFFFGGLIIDTENEDSLGEQFGTLRREVGLGREIKWGKVSRYYLDAYTRIADFYFERPTLLRFRAMRVDSNQLSDWREYSDSYDQMMDKVQNNFFVHQCGRLLGNHDTCEILVDQRQSREQLAMLLRHSNRKLRQSYDFTRDVFPSITAVDSRDYWQIQLVDLMLGAIGYKANGMYLGQDAAPHRVALMETILERLGIHSTDLPSGNMLSQSAYWPFDVTRSRRRIGDR